MEMSANPHRKGFSVDKGSDPTRFYTKGEEIFNAVTHGLGSLLGVIGTTVLVTLCAVHGTVHGAVISLIYGLSLVLLYTMSTLYHALIPARAKRVLRVFDHSTIFLLIAGTYTPMTFIALGDTWKGPALGTFVWAVAILGVVLNAINVTRFEKLSMVLYVVLGWAVVFAFSDIYRALPTPAFWLLVAGGVSYTGGIVFYKWNTRRYMHGVWHLFVLAGSVLHYLCVALYVLPMLF